MTSIQESLWGEVEPVDNFPRLSETASPDRCRKCKSMIWKVIERCGLTVQLDPEILSVQDRIDCLLAGRQTFACWKTGKGFEVDHIGDWAIRDGWFADRPKLAAHICDFTNIRTELPATYWPGKTYIVPEECPF